MYRTGDLVRWTRRTSGARVPRAASDFQVKVRGFRIELGEIDAALTAQPDVEFAVTVGSRGPGRADDSLVSYVLPADGATVDPDR